MVIIRRQQLFFMLLNLVLSGYKAMKIKTVGIVANTQKENTGEYAMRLKEWLEDRGIEVFIEAEIAAKIGVPGGLSWGDLAGKSELIAVLGGDGTMLRTARNMARYDVAIVGINMGTFGYLTEINLSEMNSALELILAGKYITEKRMMLDVVISRGKKIIATGTVLNDVVVNRGNLSRIGELEIKINDIYLTTYKADGLIISTPTGSTAYSLSAAGPIVYPRKNLIIINPICPHTLTNRPIIVPENSRLQTILWSKERGATLTLDGQESYRIKSGDVIDVKKSDYATKLVLSPHRNYWDILRTKLGWGGLTSGDKRKKNA